MSLSGDLSCEVSTSRHEDCMNMRTHAAKQRGSVLVQEGPPGFQKVPVFGEKQGPEKLRGRFGWICGQIRPALWGGYSWVLYFHATFTPFHTWVSWPNLICCLLIGLCNQVGRRAPMIQKPQDAKQKKFGKVRRNFVPQVPPAQGQQRGSMSVKAKCFLGWQTINCWETPWLSTMQWNAAKKKAMTCRTLSAYPTFGQWKMIDTSTSSAGLKSSNFPCQSSQWANSLPVKRSLKLNGESAGRRLVGLWDHPS